MGLFSFFAERTAGRKSLTGSASVLEALSQRQFSTYPALGGTNINTQRIGSAYVSVQNAAYGWIYLYQPSVRRVIDYIARNVAELGIKVYERVSDDEREHRGDHPAARALRNPNAHMSGNYFIQEFVKAHLVYGNAYALKFPGEELTLEILPPHRVGIVGQSAFTPDAYRIWRTDGTSFDVLPEQMIHWPATTGDDARRGESYLETLREALSADAAAQAAITEIHRSGLSLAGWLERPLDAPPIAPENLKRLQQDVANQMKNAKRHPPIFEEGMVYKTGGITPEDAELLAGRQFTLEYVASLYGMKNIPPVGEEERNQFYADVLPPLTTMCASFFDLSILQEEYGADDHYFEFNPEKLQAEWVKTLVSGSGRPVFTTNEARAKINLPPVDGGDELVTPLNVTPLTDKPSPMVMPIQDPNKPPQDGSHRTEDVPTPPGKGLSGKIALDGPLNGNGHHKAHLIPRRAQIDHSRNIWGGKYEEALFKHFSRQERSVTSKGLSKSLVAEALAEERWDKELASDLQELSQRHFKTAGDAYAFRVASKFDPDYGQNWLTVKAQESAKAINQTTQEHVEESGVTEAFALAVSARAAGAGKGYATDVHAFSTKVALDQDLNREVRSVTITGGDCEVCAEFQGTYPVDEVPAWPSYHQNCDCLVDIDSGSKSIGPELEVVTKAMQGYVKTIEALAHAATNGNTEGLMALAKSIAEQKPAQITVEPAQTHIHEGAVQSQTTVEAPAPAEVTIAEGAVQVDASTTVEAPPPAEVTVEAPPPAEVTIAEGAVQVDATTTVEAPPPAEITIQKGAVQNHVKVDAPPPAEVNVAPTEVNVAPAEVRFGKGAFNVEAPPPANLNLEEGAIKVESPSVNVEAPPPAEITVESPDVNVNVDARQGKRTVTFSDGSKAEIEETDGRSDQD